LNAAGETLPSDDASTFVYTRREPLGVISVITPWNFPISIPARKIAPALALGNTVVFKPASDTPLIACRLADALHRAGLPAGVLNFVTGSASKLGTPLVTHPAVRGVTFTGSTSAGEQIHRSVRLSTRVQLELGGKNPLIVLEDADLDLAVDLAIKAGFELTGQACTGTSRVIVLDAVHDAFVEKLAARTAALKVGNGMEKDTDIGPLANESQLRTVLDYVSIGAAEGARLVCGNANNGRTLCIWVFRKTGRLHRSHAADAHRPRRNFRTGHFRHSRARFLRSDGRRERRAVRLVGVDLHARYGSGPIFP